MEENYYVEPIVLHNSDMEPVAASNDVVENRRNAYAGYNTPTCSIVVFGYNRLDKTRYCVECILKYTRDVDYELILIDNGSSDGTFEFFESVPYHNKVVYRVEKNVGAGYPVNIVMKHYRGKYIVFVGNDVYVTKNWLSNLLRCAESDPSIGLVMPVSSNVSNLQQVDLGYRTMEQMQERAAAFNQSDPLKWEEQMRLITVINIYSRELIDLVGVPDPGFVHDFLEDDYCIRIRRAGYRLMLCRDTFICHDHDFRVNEDKDPEAFRQSLISGRNIYRRKWFGIDAWDDFNNYELEMMSYLERSTLPQEVHSLCIDVRCGMPVLGIKNVVRRKQAVLRSNKAFTTQAKYFLDLQTVADEDVKCDRIDFIQDYYANSCFDVILVGQCINLYSNPILLLQKLYDMLRDDGLLLFKLRNVNDIYHLLSCMGRTGGEDPELPVNLPMGQLNQCLKMFGRPGIQIQALQGSFSPNDREFIADLMNKANGKADKGDIERLMVKDFLYCVKKQTVE